MLALVRQAFTGRYEVEREIGRGGNARIFLARDPTGQAVALKILHPELLVSVAADRFLREIRLASRLSQPGEIEKVERLRPIADELGCSLAQLSIAWCAANPRVSTVLTGASRASQVVENFAAMEVLGELTPEIMQRIDAAVA